MSSHERYMYRCIELARLAGSDVRSNPNVGSVLVHNGRIIGEGYHKRYGGQHAERNAVDSVLNKDRHLIKESKLYVSLEPCMIYGKTPPCSDLILEQEIKELIVGCLDPNPLMQGKSIEYLKGKGLKVTQNILEKECEELIAPFRANLDSLPYIIIKYAQSSDNYIGKVDQQIWLSNDTVKWKTHLWRSQIDAILVGYNTAKLDDPKLTTRLVPGKNPMRILLDRNMSLDPGHHLWSDDHKTIFVTDLNTKTPNYHKENKKVIKLAFDPSLAKNLCHLLYQEGINRLMIEGGAKTIKMFQDSNLWHETRVIKTGLQLKSGIRAPFFKSRSYKLEKFLDNTIYYYFNQSKS